MSSCSAIHARAGKNQELPGTRAQRNRTHKVEVILSPEAFDIVRPSLEALSLKITLTQVNVCAPHRRQFYRGAEYSAPIPKVKLEIIASAVQLPDVAYALSRLTESELDDVFLYDAGSMPVPFSVQRRGSL